MSRTIWVLVDYKGEFYCPHKRTIITTNLERTSLLFDAASYEQRICHFEDIDFREQDFNRQFVLYQSSQDRGLFYKGFIEDVILGLHIQGAHLIPDFYKFRAHHNKVFMEILRDLNPLDSVKRLRSRCFGTYEAFERRLDSLSFPLVIKAAAGDTGSYVHLVHTPEEAKRTALKISAQLQPVDWMENLTKSVKHAGFIKHSTHRNKFIVQEYIPNLNDDFKVLHFGERAFVMHRTVRPGDFRASGSGMPLGWPAEVPDGLLSFCDEIYQVFDVPYASMDVMYDGTTYYLGEIQFLRFGTIALMGAQNHFIRTSEGWQVKAGTSNWEETLVDALVRYMDRHQE